MKIILLATAEQKEEWMAQCESMPAELVWSAELTALANGRNADACIDLQYDGTEERLKRLKQLQTELIIINHVLFPLNELTSGCVRINGWNTFLKRPVVEAAGADNRKKAETIFSFFNKQANWVADITGFISLRVVASIINEAYFALAEKVSTKDEIDTAMKLGTNYPYGPFEWSKRIGLENIYTLLTLLSKEQKRYEPSPLLTKEAGF